jgi:hypothetical protein
MNRSLIAKERYKRLNPHMMSPATPVSILECEVHVNCMKVGTQPHFPLYDAHDYIERPTSRCWGTRVFQDCLLIATECSTIIAVCWGAINGFELGFSYTLLLEDVTEEVIHLKQGHARSETS